MRRFPAALVRGGSPWLCVTCLPLVITALVTFAPIDCLFVMAKVVRMPGMIALMGTHAGTNAARCLLASVAHNVYANGNRYSGALEET